MNQLIPHLIELRTRLLRVTSIVIAIFMILFWQDEILFYNALIKPILLFLPEGSKLIATEITSTFTIPMKLALITAIFITIPYILYEIWSFIAPGLYKHEKQTLLPILSASICLFYVGGGFAYFILCPLALKFFINCAPMGVTLMTDIRHYLDFVFTMVLSSGIAFQVPIITLIAIRFGFISTMLLTHLRPYVIVLAFILGMLLTPPDVVSQILLALPLWGLFEAGLWLGKRLEIGKIA